MSRELYEKAYGEFWDLHSSDTGPTWPPLSYDLCKAVREKQWNMMMDMHISWDLSELINLLNDWRLRLREWHCWMSVLQCYGEQDSWALRDHFLESLVFFCMLQPSATRDRLGSHATEVVHQANLVVDPSYEDKLDQDKLKPGRFLRRAATEKQLERIGIRWSKCATLVKALNELDSEAYKRVTRDFRNKVSHAIAPRFEFGDTNLITRSIEPWTIIAERRDGMFESIPHPTKKAVSYGFGGTPALSLREMFDVISKEHERAIVALSTHQDLIREILPLLKDQKLLESSAPV